jgi:formyltetrahydrofolate-dependent phosphoribosylglycinamide formyltransferase
VTAAPLDIAVFASGGGTNLQALLDHEPVGCRWRVALLVCNRPAGAMERGRAAGVECVVVPTKDRDADELARETLDVLSSRGIDLICLAGYLRMMPPDVVARYRGRILNVHPALLPDFGGQGMYGMRVHEAVVAARVPFTGATVHFVDEEYDRGAVVAQARVRVHPTDTPDDVAARVLQVEHDLYPRAVDHVCAAIAAGHPVEPMPMISHDPPPEPSEARR